MREIIFPMFINSSKGGMQEIVLNLLGELLKNGYHCRLLTTSNSELVDACLKHKIPCSTIKVKQGRLLSLIMLALGFIAFVFRHRHSLFIVNDIFSHILLSFYLLPKTEIFVSHGGDYKRSGKIYASNSGISAIIAKNYSFKRVDRFVAVSGTQKTNLITNAKVDSKKIVVISNSVCPIERVTNTSASTRVSIVGYIKPLKNQLEVIKAIDILRKDGIEVVLNIFGSVASPEYNKILQDYISENNMSNQVVFWGFIEDKNLIYSNTDILISASYHEGFGLTIIEAMSCSIPTIAYQGAEGPSSIIKNDETGILVDKNQCNYYANAIKKYIMDKAYKLNICNNAQIEFKSKYTVKKMTESYKQVIDEFIK